MSTRNVVAAAIASLTLLGATVRGESPSAPEEARAILNATGVRGGLIVHLGCGDGRLTAALRAGEGYLVHGLDADAENVAAAREHVRSLGLYGPVSVDRLTGKRLPYVDNLVALLVAERPGDVSMDEIVRVLAPGGVAYLWQDGRWTRHVKPRPEEIDEWTHFLRDATNNAVAHDLQVGPPRHVQWLAGPMWSRNHHRLASVSSVVTSGGRLFYIADEATGASMQVPGKWSLIARDAFSGVLLWKRPLDSWAWHQQRFRSGPVQLPRTLVAVGDRVYAPLGLSAPVSALDAATGELVRTYDQTDGAEEILVDRGVLYAVTGSPKAEQALVGPAARAKARVPANKAIVALRAESGEVLWKWSDPERSGPLPVTLAVAGGRVFFAEAAGAVCLDNTSGEELWFAPAPYAPQGSGEQVRYGPDDGRMPGWMSPSPVTVRNVGWSVGTLVVHDGVVLWAGMRELRAIVAESGDILWACPCRPGYCRAPVDVLAVGSEVWIGPDFDTARDLRTGEITRQNDVLENLWTAGHHHRCYREKATDRYLITSHRGVEFLDLTGDEHSRNNWTRGVCQYGILPANGLLYAPPHVCACFIEAKLFGFWAFSSDSSQPPETDDTPRLEKGPALAGRGDTPRGSSPATRHSPPATPAHWPTYRGNPERSGSTDAAVSGDLRPVWQTPLGGKLTQPVVAGGRVFAASVDTGELFALDAGSGDVLWSFLAGGRIDSPPTIHEGLALFGSADGSVYCLRADDGALAWRFRAAPADRRTVARDRLESVWPVHGSVLVHGGVAYVAAGRSSYLDGGIRLFALDPATGKVLHKATLATAHPTYRDTMADKEAKTARFPFDYRGRQFAMDWKSHTDPDRSDPFAMEGAVTDVLVADGESIYMRQVALDESLRRRNVAGRHLFSTTRLLNGDETHRTHQVLGTGNFKELIIPYSWLVNGRPRPGVQYLRAPHGLLVVFDDATAWGVRHNDGRYQLFAEAIRPRPPGEGTSPDFVPLEKGTKVPDWQWSVALPFRPRAMLRAGDSLFVAGMDGIGDPARLDDAYEGRRGGTLWVVSAADGTKQTEHRLAFPPVWEGMAAAGGRLYLSTTDGKVLCYGGG